MTTEEKVKPADKGGTSGGWFSRLLDGSHDHYTCLLPEDIGSFTSLLLKLFYSGIKVDKTQIETIRQLDKDAVVIFVTKLKNYFEFLFDVAASIWIRQALVTEKKIQPGQQNF